MGISPVSVGGVSPAYNVGTAAPASAPAVQSAESSAAAPDDLISLDGGQDKEVSEKHGLLHFVKDFVSGFGKDKKVDEHKTPFFDETCSRLKKVLVKAKPGDIPDTMPKHERKGGEPTDFYIPGFGSHSGISLPLLSEKAPTMTDVADFKNIECSEAEKIYNQQGLADKLSPMQKRVLKEYSGWAFAAMNSYLINGKDNAAGTVGKAVRCAAGALDKGEVPAGVVLHRTADLEELLNYCGKKDFAKYEKLADSDKMEGLANILNKRLTGTQTDRKTFISTCVGSKSDFIDKPEVTTKFYIGSGVKGIYLTGDPDLVFFNGENEYLLAPDTPATVLGVEYDPDSEGLLMHVFLGDKN